MLRAEIDELNKTLKQKLEEIAQLKEDLEETRGNAARANGKLESS